MARRKSRFLIGLAMTLIIAVGAALFFIIGINASEVAKDELAPKATPKARAGGAFDGLLKRKLSAANLKKVADGFRNPHGIGVFRGKLYVSDWGDDKLYEVNPDTGAKRLIADEIGGAHDMVMDSEGQIVTPLFKEDRLVRVNPESGQVKELTRRLAGPNGITKARGGYYVTNNKNGTVVRVAPTGQKRTILRGLDQPGGIVVDNENIIRVAQFGSAPSAVLQILDSGKRSAIVRNLESAESLIYDRRKNLLIGHTVAGRGALTLFSAGGRETQVLQTELPGPLVGPVTDGRYLYIESAAPEQTAIYRIALP